MWLLLIAILLAAAIALGFYGWRAEASTGDAVAFGLFGWRPPWGGDSGPTATPTKTPAALVTATATPTPLPELPTLTPSVTPTEAAVLAVSTARPNPPTATSTPRPPLDDRMLSVAQEHGIEATGHFVVIDQNQQRMHVIEDGHELRTLPVSSGDPDSHFVTPPWSGVVGEYWGSFSAGGVWGDNAWYLFELDGGGTILVHSAPYVLEDGVKVYQELDAVGMYPASRGCIRLLPDDAQWFSDWEPQGVPVVILPWDGGTSREG